MTTVFAPRVLGGFEAPRALAAARLAAAVYGPDLPAVARDLGLGRTERIERGSTQAAVCWSRTGAAVPAVVAAWAGSGEWRDWIDNALIWRTRPDWLETVPSGVACHLGFQRAYRRAERDVRIRVRMALEESGATGVWLTGHSLAGAEVYLARAHFAEAGIPVLGAYALNAPRVGNRAWARWFDGRFQDLWRVVVVSRGVQDLVTRIPRSGFPWRYWHAGRPVVIRDGRCFETEEEWERVRAEHPVSELQQWRIVSRLRTSIAAHLAGRLVRDLEAHVGWAEGDPVG